MAHVRTCPNGRNGRVFLVEIRIHLEVCVQSPEVTSVVRMKRQKNLDMFSFKAKVSRQVTKRKLPSLPISCDCLICTLVLGGLSNLPGRFLS